MSFPVYHYPVMATKPFFRMSLIVLAILPAFRIAPAGAADASARQATGEIARKPVGKTEAGLPVTYEGQRMNPGRETPKQMETLLRKQYVEWIMSWKLPQGDRPVREAVPAIRLPKLKFNLQRCSEANARFRHPKPKELNRVSTIRVDNQCAAEKVSQALEPMDSSGGIEGAEAPVAAPYKAK